MPIITCNSILFKAAAMFASKETTRPQIAGVHIQPCPSGTGVRLVATDGHTLIMVHDPEGSAPVPVLVLPSKSILAACKRPKKWMVDPVLTIDTDAKTATIGDTIQANALETECEFPNVYRVFPKELPDNPVTFPAHNAEYLARFSDALDILGTGPKCINLVSGGDDKPTWVLAPYHPNFIGLIMPWRKDKPVLPDWFNPSYTTQAAA